MLCYPPGGLVGRRYIVNVTVSHYSVCRDGIFVSRFKMFFSENIALCVNFGLPGANFGKSV
jgi:hypothetical protein